MTSREPAGVTTPTEARHPVGRRARRAWCVGLGLALGVATACETDRDERGSDAAGLLPAAAGPTASPPGDVYVTLDEWTLQLGRDTVPSGAMIFQVMNRGDYTHALEVEGAGREWVSPRVEPGATTTLSAELAPGTYEVYCPVEDSHGSHAAKGMRTRLVVR